MFSIFKKYIKSADLSFLGVDMHSHLIPGIDDGSKSVRSSLEILTCMAELGYKKVITTPHIMSDYYPNDRDTIMTGLKTVKQAISDSALDIEMEAAAEYFVDDYFLSLLNGDDRLLTFSGNYVLIEFSMLGKSIDPQYVIFELIAKGYIPIIAHPERYLYYKKNLDIFSSLYDRGAKFQVNLLSLAGHYGDMQKKIGYQLIEMGIVDYLGTDIHRLDHVDKITKLSTNSKFIKMLSKHQFLNKNL